MMLVMFSDQMESSASEGSRWSKARPQRSELIDLTNDDAVVIPCPLSTCEAAEGDGGHPLLLGCREVMKQAQQAFGKGEEEDVRGTYTAPGDWKDMVIELAEGAGKILENYLRSSEKFRFVNRSHVDCNGRCQHDGEKFEESESYDDMRSYWLQFDAGWHLSHTSW
eukprot:749703-Hanusia_phi.AAC.2